MGVVLRLARRPIDGTVGGLPNRRQLKKIRFVSDYSLYEKVYLFYTIYE